MKKEKKRKKEGHKEEVDENEEKETEKQLGFLTSWSTCRRLGLISLLLISARRTKNFKNFKQTNAVLLFSYNCLSFIKSYIKTQLVCLKVLAWR